MNPNDADSSQSERLVTVETEVRGLARTVEHLSALIVDSQRQSRSDFAALGDKMALMRQANWPLYIAATVLVLSVGTAAFSPILVRLASIEAGIRDTGSEITTHKLLPIHPVAAVELQELRRRIEKIENKP
jgi:hypothetical protein